MAVTHDGRGLTPTFDLATRPWLKVVGTDGSRREVSLVELFEEAHTIARLDGELPTQDAAILRLLLALSLVAVADDEMDESSSIDRWCTWWRDWTELSEQVLGYLGKHSEEFDLLHPERPFLQQSHLQPAGRLEPGLDRLVPDDGQWFSTRAAGQPLSLSEAARWLVHAQGYTTAGIHTGQQGDPTVKGGKGYPNGFPAWLGNVGLVIWHGSTLAQTILLNLPLGAAPNERVAGWQMQRPVHSVRDPAPGGIARLLVWPSRRIRLHVDADDLVRTVQVSYGDMVTPYNLNWCEPMSAWRLSEAQSKKAKHDVMMPVTHDPTKQVWRQLGSLLATERGRPATAVWLATLLSEQELDGSLPVRMQIVGMQYGPQNSSVETVIDDAVTAPLAALVSGQLTRLLDQGVQLSQQGVGALTLLASRLAQATGSEPERARERAAQGGYAAIDPVFREWMGLLTVPAEADAYLIAWHRLLRRELLRFGQQLVTAAGPSGSRGRKVNGELVSSASAWTAFHTKVLTLTPHAYAQPTAPAKDLS